MLEHLIARVKLTLFVVLFLSPVAVSAWSKSLDRWLESNHRFDAPEARIRTGERVPDADLLVATNGFKSID